MPPTGDCAQLPACSLGRIPKLACLLLILHNQGWVLTASLSLSQGWSKSSNAGLSLAGRFGRALCTCSPATCQSELSTPLGVLCRGRPRGEGFSCGTVSCARPQGGRPQKVVSQLLDAAGPCWPHSLSPPRQAAHRSALWMGREDRPLGQRPAQPRKPGAHSLPIPHRRKPGLRSPLALSPGAGAPMAESGCSPSGSSLVEFCSRGVLKLPHWTLDRHQGSCLWVLPKSFPGVPRLKPRGAGTGSPGTEKSQPGPRSGCPLPDARAGNVPRDPEAPRGGLVHGQVPHRCCRGPTVRDVSSGHVADVTAEAGRR